MTLLEDDECWETPRGMDSFVAMPDGGFSIKTPLSEQQARVPCTVPLEAVEHSSAKLNTQKAMETAKKTQSMAEIKAAGRAKVKAQQEARAAEREAQRLAASLWESAFDYTFDSTTDPAARSDFLLDGRTVLIIVPGFASWLSLTQAHVDRWKEAAILKKNTAYTPGGSGYCDSSCTDAISLVFKWPCGEVAWTNEDAQVEAAAAWQVAHEATFAAARSLTVLLQKLKDLGCSLVVAAHSLGARVALQALANDLAAPKIDGLLLLGAAVDNYALTGLNPAEWASNDLNGGIVVEMAGQGTAVFAPAEFPFGRLMGKCTSLALAHSSKDHALTRLWQAAEYARCGRVAPPALGATGPVEEELEAEQYDEEWMERVLLLDVTQELGTSHDPTEYLLARGVQASVRAALFP